MKKIVITFLCGSTCIVSAFAESFLKATNFPKTFEDLSFKARMDALTDGYIPYEISYDEHGNCISGCAYPGVTLQDDMNAVDEANDKMSDLISNTRKSPDKDARPGPSTTPDTPGHDDISVTPPSSRDPATDWCHNGLSTTLPLRYPVDMTNFKYKVTSDFGFRTSSPNGARFHPALDIGTPIGTPVYATADGVVEAVDNQDTPGGGGLYVNIKHDNGLITQFIHLSKALVNKGDRVRACDKIALSGNSGKNTSGQPYDPHLDYRIRFASNRNNFVDILCPCKTGNKSDNSSGNNNLNIECVHSLFNAPYKFTSYNPNTDNIKRSLWRVKYGHCMKKNTDLLPNEVK